MGFDPDRHMTAQPCNGIKELVGRHARHFPAVEFGQARLRNADKAAECHLAQRALLLHAVEHSDKIGLVCQPGGNGLVVISYLG